MTASELHGILLSTLARQAGGSQRRWRLALGPIRLHDAATHAHCNWSFAPSGTVRENERIEALLDDLRLRHPLVTPG